MNRFFAFVLLLLVAISHLASCNSKCLACSVSMYHQSMGQTVQTNDLWVVGPDCSVKGNDPAMRRDGIMRHGASYDALL